MNETRIIRESTYLLDWWCLLSLPGLLCLIVLICILASCASKPTISPEGPYWKDDDRKSIPEPDYYEPNLIWTSVDRTIFDKTLELLDLDRSVRKIAGNPTRAMNTNSYDEVPNSSWFTNRMGLPQTQLTPEEIIAGTNRTGGPDTSGTWMVFRPKIGGVTPGFWIEDIHGNQYIIKFDPKGYPDMSTGATTMAGRFFHACGYNVAEEYIVYWRPENLKIRDGATVKGADGNKRPLAMEDIQNILDHIEQQPDGRIRSLASLLLGNVKGPYSLRGTNKNDPNDWCPHENRRELRGLYVLASFANHFDIKDHNSMDVYMGDDGQGYLDHYLMDFGSTFGSAGHGPMSPINGYANLMDVRDMGVSVLTLGLKKWQWEDAKPPTNNSVGYYESEIFHPGKWNPVYPIPPFENMTDQDGYWGAKIMLAFRDKHLRALVKAGQYADREAEEYLFKTMKERRDKIGRYWFGKINPLDYPSIENAAKGGHLSLVDLAVEYGLEPATGKYRYEIRQNGKRIIDPTDTDRPKITLSSPELGQTVTAPENDASILLEVRVRSKRENGWTKDAIFWLIYDQATRRFKVVGIEH